MRQLWIIDPSRFHSDEQGIAEVLCGWRGAARVFRPCLAPGDGPDPATGYTTDGLVLLGSAASVHDPDPWIDLLSAWLRPVLCGEIVLPVLGVCFGQQLVAHAAGGRVGYAREDRSKIAGVETSRLEGGRLLPGSHDLRVVISHREEVFELPPGYRAVASRASCSVDGMEHEALPVFSFQFHPEAREEFAGRAGFDPALIDDRLRHDGQLVLAAFRERARANGS